MRRGKPPKYSEMDLGRGKVERIVQVRGVTLGKGRLELRAQRMECSMEILCRDRLLRAL